MQVVRILLVDDEVNVLAALGRLLRRAFGTAAYIETCAQPGLALQRISEASFDVVVSDYRMPGMDGLQLLGACRQLQPETTRVILSGITDFDVLMSAINDVGIMRFMLKPWDEEEFVSVMCQAVAATRKQRLQHSLLDEGVLHDLPADEPGVLHVRRGPHDDPLLDVDRRSP
ncbi:response regulator [Uliginosibacterium sediminicola]|uniref:Response regulator n=1 Tax=Uliginosibacterium sediminicola TaxID=2024550 RepID=A0ABU9YT50_9RHOO